MANELYATAIHEAGHAVAAALLGKRFNFSTIRPKDDALGYIKYWTQQAGLLKLIDGTSGYLWSNEAIDRYVRRAVIIAYAGHAAELKGTGNENQDGATSDYNNIADLVISHVGGDELGELFCTECRMAAEKLIREYWNLIEAVADELLNKTTINSKEVYSTVGPACNAGKKYLIGYSKPPVNLLLEEIKAGMISDA